MNVEISVGEAIDKLSILEIKYERIHDEEKKTEIKKEIDALCECGDYKNTHKQYYDLLIYVNTKLWDMTDVIQHMNMTESNYAILSSELFILNQKRYRLKRIFNLLTSSNIKEQKNNKLKSCKVVIYDEELFYKKLSEINSLILDYDVIYFESSFISSIQSLFTISTFCYNNENIDECTTIIDLLSLNIEENLKKILIFAPITYVAGGMFGDFIHQLSVINENFYKYGRKGILYITDLPHLGGDGFRFGLSNTFMDTYETIKAQIYIEDYKIYNNEPFEINLNDWRKNLQLHSQGWHITYKQVFDVDWGKHTWINTLIDDTFKDKVLINTSNHRFCENIDYHKLYSEYPNDLIFIAVDDDQYNYFVSRTNLQIPYYRAVNFTCLCIAINSCKLFVGSRSGPLTIAHATHVPQIIGTPNNEPDPITVMELQNCWSNVKYGYN